MKNYKTYGASPYTTFLIHGGPAAAGELAPLSKIICTEISVVEPFQTKRSISELLTEMKEVIDEIGIAPVNLVGYSWGAWLSFIFSSVYPELVYKLILVGSGPFEEKYVQEMIQTRISRMTDLDKIKHDEIMEQLSKEEVDRARILSEFGKLMSKIDNYDSIPDESNHVNIDFEIYENVWGEASILRKNGELLEYGRNITCPVIAIHGTYDPHPYMGVIEPLSKIIKDFRGSKPKLVVDESIRV
ncbi:alpha/beta hydrolase [Paenibacillus zanthoxyli]|uniref:alpha/beta hydrolase n=1 Tax=Paenibacillus zanthoxyli TaxID=369399 RepID=UPI0004729805|nr:alpha/beta hydrolase [Paenibacillus zanthoxyli]